MRSCLVAVAFALAVGATAFAQQPLSPADLPPPPLAELPNVPPPMPLPTPLPKTEPTPDAKPEPPADPKLQGKWKNGLRLESEDKDFSLFIGGRFQFDMVDYISTRELRTNIPGTNPLEEGVSFRRLRLDAGGTIYKTIDYLAQIDFINAFVTVPGTTRATDIAVPTDVWVTFRELPVIGNLRVGNQKAWISFEHLVSSRFLPFLERSLGFDAFIENFNNGFSPGVSAFDNYHDGRGMWGVGLYKNVRNPFGWGVGRNELDLTGRVTYLPVDAAGGRVLVHVGVGASHRDADDDLFRSRARLDIRNSPSALASLAADTELFPGSKQNLVVPEFAAVFGPVSVQAEYYANWFTGARTARGVPQGTVYFQSAYAEVGYFLTGEHREYDHANAVFTRVTPKSPVTWTRAGFTGCGAWQVLARYCYLDLKDKDINGGVVHDLTLGVNWFLNPNMKVQWNYFLAGRNVANPAGDGIIHGFGTRLAIDF